MADEPAKPAKSKRPRDENAFGLATLKMIGYADELYLVPLTNDNLVYRAHLDTMGNTDGEFELQQVLNSLDKAGGHSIGTKRASLKGGQVVMKLWTIHIASDVRFEVEETEESEYEEPNE